MEENIITAIVYTEIHDTKGPIPTCCYPPDLNEDIQISVSIKSSTILATDQGILPDSLIFIPFPALNLKGIIKYLDRKDETRRGGSVHSAITLLFREMDDLIYYKYSRSLEKAFDKAAQKIIDIESKRLEENTVLDEIKELRQEVLDILENLSVKEIQGIKQPFPEKKAQIEPNFIFKIIVIGDARTLRTCF